MLYLYLAIFILILGLLLLWLAARSQKSAGLPGGRIIYTDTRAWGSKLEKSLYDSSLGLTGKPDYLVEKDGQIIPVEVKSGRAPEEPYDSHIFQLAVYCLLVEKTMNRKPPYGIIHYENRDFAIDYTDDLRKSVLDLLIDIRSNERRSDIPRSHNISLRCAKCGFRNVCEQKL